MIANLQEKVNSNFVSQKSKSECGLVAIKSILKMYGMNPNIEFDTKEGTSPTKITKTLNDEGILTHPHEITFSNLSPKSIAYYPKKDHYITIEKIMGNHLLVNDGLKRDSKWLGRGEFEKEWLKNGKGWVIDTSKKL